MSFSLSKHSKSLDKLFEEEDKRDKIEFDTFVKSVKENDIHACAIFKIANHIYKENFKDKTKPLLEVGWKFAWHKIKMAKTEYETYLFVKNVIGEDNDK